MNIDIVILIHDTAQKALVAAEGDVIVTTSFHIFSFFTESEIPTRLYFRCHVIILNNKYGRSFK